MTSDQLTRFLAKVQVDPENGCWLWVGAIEPHGYGRFMLDGRRRPGRRPHAAHRVSYEHFTGSPIAEKLVIDHLCRTPRCVNPEHLEAVTHRENVRRGIKGVLTTHCPHGHIYDKENTGTNPTTGHRFCRICKRRNEKIRRAKRRAERRYPLTVEDGA